MIDIATGIEYDSQNIPVGKKHRMEIDGVMYCVRSFGDPASYWKKGKILNPLYVGTRESFSNGETTYEIVTKPYRTVGHALRFIECEYLNKSSTKFDSYVFQQTGLTYTVMYSALSILRDKVQCRLKTCIVRWTAPPAKMRLNADA